MVEWDEPMEGRNKDGSLATCHRRVTMSNEDAIKVARHANPDASASDQELLTDFMLIHWATLTEG